MNERGTIDLSSRLSRAWRLAYLSAISMIGAVIAGIALTIALLAAWPVRGHLPSNDYATPVLIAIGGMFGGTVFGFFFTFAAEDILGAVPRLSRRAIAAFALCGTYAFLSPLEIHSLAIQHPPGTLLSSRSLWLIAVGLAYFAIGGAGFIAAIRWAIGRAFPQGAIIACVMLTLAAGLAAATTELDQDELMFWHTPFWLILMAGITGFALPVKASRGQTL